MTHTALLTLDGLPSPPKVSISASGQPSHDTVVDFFERALATLQTLNETRLDLERYVAITEATLNRLVKDAEKRGAAIADIDPLITELLQRETSRAKKLVPLVKRMRAKRAQLTKRKGFAYQFLLAGSTELVQMEEAMLSELEALRDTRLRLEVLRAKLINRKEKPGPVFDSGAAAASYLRLLRK